jgi:uncharacterized membrane protein YccC
MGFVLGLPALLLCYSLVLPAANGFTMLAIGLLPFLFFGAWLMYRPATAQLGSGYFLMFLNGLGLNGVMHYDFIAMLNNALAQLTGIAAATLSLAVLVPANRAWRPQRAVRLLFDSLRVAHRAPLPNLKPRFESRVRDLTIQLIGLRPPGTSPDDDEALGLIILEAGDAIIRLRNLALDDAPALRAELDECSDIAVKAVVRQDREALHRAEQGLRVIYRKMAGDAGESLVEKVDNTTAIQTLAALRILLLALEDFDATLKSSATEMELAHAA